MKTWLRDILKAYLLPALILINAYSVGTIWYLHSPGASRSQALAVPIPTPMPLAQTVKKGIPATLKIPALGIDLPVADGSYNSADASWTLSSDKAHYANLTVPVNDQRGNTMIYGHNNPQVFAALERLQPGMEAEVITTAGDHFYYSFTDSLTIRPNDLTSFDSSGSPRLTLQTCSGAWFENRQMFQFALSRVNAPAATEVERQATRDSLITNLQTLLPAPTKQ